MFNAYMLTDPDPSPSVAPHGPPSVAPSQPAASASASSSTTGPPGKLPTTGVDGSGLLLLALAVGAVGVGLVAVSGRWRRHRAS